jgi:hypothetical protein
LISQQPDREYVDDHRGPLQQGKIIHILRRSYDLRRMISPIPQQPLMQPQPLPR